MTTRRPIIGGNWKMNTDLAAGVELAEDVVAGIGSAIESCDVAIFPPFPYIQAVGRALGHHGLTLGAQDVYYETNGAFTGEISTEMLLDLNATMVLVGHSERRHVIGETDELIARKLEAASAAGLSVVLCIGETMEQREADRTHAVLDRQLGSALESLDADAMHDVVIAYEPVWAIGTGRTATPADAEREHAFVRERLAALFDPTVADATRIQYGGSVKAANAADLIAMDNIDGFLVGGASLRSDEFLNIIGAAAGASSSTLREAPNA